VSLATPAPAVSVTAAALAHRYAPGRGLEPLDFSIAAPGVVAITGPNGSGKSTLLRIVAGLLHVTRGNCEVTVDGRVIPAPERRTVTGFAAPELAFYDELSVDENLRFAAAARGGGPADSAIADALGATGLDARAHDRVAALSSGLRQRMRLAFAILHRPVLLLLDEPGSHLDAPGREVVERILDRHRSQGLVLLATNDEREWRLADRRIELRSRGLGDPV